MRRLRPSSVSTRLDRDAVRLHRAVAAALAHALVDHHAPVRVRGTRRACAGAAPRRRRSGRRPAPMTPGTSRSSCCTPSSSSRWCTVTPAGSAAGAYLSGSSLTTAIAPHALGGELARDLRRRDRAVHRLAFDRLAAGHRDRAVDEQLVGDVHTRRHGGADREQARVEVGAVAHVLEDVRHRGEGRLADPVGALGTHLRDREGAPLRDPDGHAVAADAALARCEPSGTTVDVLCGQPEQKLGRRRSAGGRRRRGGREGRAQARPSSGARRSSQARIAPATRAGASSPSGNARRAALVALAEEERAASLVVEQARELVLDHRPLLFDDEHVLETFAEAPRALGLEGPGHRHLVDREAGLLREGVAEAQLVEGLSHVEVGLARRHDAEAPALAAERHAIEAVRAHEGLRRREPLLVEARFDLERVVGPADVQAGRRREVLGEPHLHPAGTDLDGGRAVDGVGQALEAHPAARVARQGPAVEAEVEVLLHARRVQHRDAAVDQGVLALVRDRGGLGARVVAGQHQHAALRSGAGVVAVLQGVARAVDAGALPVPDGEHAVVLRALEEVRLLGAPDRRRSEVFVHAGLEADVVRLELLAGLPEREVVGAERRAAVARDEARRREARREVAPALLEGQPHQRLHARQVDAPALARVAVLEPVAAVDGGAAHAVG